MNDTRISDLKVHHVECSLIVSYPLGLVKGIRMQLTKIAELYTNMAQWTVKKTMLYKRFDLLQNLESGCQKSDKFQCKSGNSTIQFLI